MSGKKKRKQGLCGSGYNFPFNWPKHVPSIEEGWRDYIDSMRDRELSFPNPKLGSPKARRMRE